MPPFAGGIVALPSGMSQERSAGVHYRRRRKRIAASAAVVVAAGLGIGIGFATTGGGPSHRASAASTKRSTVTTRPPSTTTTVPSGPTTTAPPHLSITAPIPVSATVAVPGGTMALNAGVVSFTHVVAAGENLSFIANWYFEMGGTSALYAFNQATIGPNPNLIYPGDRLTVTMSANAVPKVSPAWPPLQKLEADG